MYDENFSEKHVACMEKKMNKHVKIELKLIPDPNPCRAIIINFFMPKNRKALFCSPKSP